MKQTIQPKKVIQETESSNDSSTTVIHTIVAVDEQNDTCWNNKGEQFVLSEVETWAQVPSNFDIFNQPIPPISATVIGADGKPFTDTLMPMLQPIETKEQQIETINVPFVRTESELPQPEWSLSTAASTIVPNELSKYMTNQKEQFLHDEEAILALLSNMADDEIDANQCYVQLMINAKVEIANILQAAKLLKFSPMDVIAVMFKHNMIRSVTMD